jgi:CheY-like chemotaxis protein
MNASTTTILVIDDDQDIREMVGLVFEIRGHRALLAADGGEAFDLLHRGVVPDVILLDIMMPGMNGVDFMRTLKSDPNLADIPVVVLSGDASARKTATQLAAAACLSKPIDVDRLLEAVERVATRR